MNSKRFIRLSLCLTLVLLILAASVQIVIDPLFQYHKPWLGMEPVITDERYQNAGIGRNFDFDNVIIGNSLSENFKPSDVSKAFGGETVKLTASGSHTLDWTYVLNVLKKRESPPKNVMFNLDPYIFHASDTELKHELPTYLYDNNYFNDVNYLFNFSVFDEFTVSMITRNRKNSIPDYDSFMVADDFDFSEDFVLAHYTRPELNTNEPSAVEMPSKVVSENLNLLLPYLETMEDTQFVFFFSPFSMLYWDSKTRENVINQEKADYLTACSILTKYDNVTLYLWIDEEMIDIMSDLNNYVDEVHYSPYVCELMSARIGKHEGIISEANYKKEINKLFDYIENFDYNSYFE